MTDIVYKPYDKSVNTDFTVKKTIVDFTALLLEKGTLITVSERLFNAQHELTLYQPGLGKVFFLVSAQVTCFSTGGTAAGRIGLMGVEPNASYNWILRVQAPTGQTVSATINPAIPMRVVNGQRIMMYSRLANMESDACVFGYEIDESILADFPTI